MKNTDTNPKPIYPIRKKLKLCFCLWLIFRLFAIPFAMYFFLTNKPNVFSVMVWQAIWLIPAFACTPFIIKAKSPYALLWISIIMLVYAGASGFMIFLHGFAGFWAGMLAWSVDFLLLIAVNVWLFILLKRLPKMNG